MSREDIQLRIRELINELELTEYSFSQKVSIDKSNLSKILSGQRSIGDAVINKIVLATHCNKEWLKTGKGKMFKPQTTEEAMLQLSVKERLIQLIEYKRIPKEDFYVKIGMTSASFRGNAKNTPLNSNAIENILSEMPDVNSDWLLTGKGEMLKPNDARSVSATLGDGNKYINVGTGINSIVSEPDAPYGINTKDEKIRELENRIIELEATVKAKDDFIKMLMETKNI